MNRSSQTINRFNPIKKRKIYDEVYDQLISLISTGGLKPGEQLPSRTTIGKRTEGEQAIDQGGREKGGSPGADFGPPG